LRETPHTRAAQQLAPTKELVGGRRAAFHGPPVSAQVINGRPESRAVRGDLTQGTSPLTAEAARQGREAANGGPTEPAQFEALPRPEPRPLEGDVIAYRILHIGADWTPQARRSCHHNAVAQGVSTHPWKHLL
jgi:hypothetical protein